MIKHIMMITVLFLLMACTNHDISKDQKLEKSPCACNKPEFVNHAV